MEQNKWNCMIHTITIIVLLLIIAVWSFFMWRNYNNTWKNNTDNNVATNEQATNITFKVIDDERCINCQTDAIISQLQQIPVLGWIAVEKKDFKDEGVEDYLKENNITMLPAVIFSTKNVDSSINPYLQELPSKEYSLQIWASFNPFAERSEKWFLILDKDKYEEILEWSYIKGNKDAKITWLEYSDIECPYCAKLHNSWTPEEVAKKYGDDINTIYHHFPLDFHENAMPWAQILECIWELNWSEDFYKLLDIAYGEEKSDKEFLVNEAVKLWVNKSSLEKCISENKYKEKIQTQQSTWNSLFWIQWTPGNVLINTETLEYEILSWAYPTEYFTNIIDKLLK